MPRLTFYTQAYNTEKYMKKCIESILNQTFTDFEYLLVDNGSTDGTKDIIAEYAKKDNRIRAIRYDENRRRFWAELIKEDAKGEYFAMLDSDDWYEPVFAEKMLKTILETGADLASCASNIIVEYSNTPPRVKRISDKTTVIERRDFSSSFPIAYIYYGAVWGRLYKTSLIKENNISLAENVAFGIDTLFVLKYQQHCKSVAFNPEPLHSYLIRSKSVSYEFNKNALENDENLYKAFYSYLEDIGGLTELNLAFISAVYLGLITSTTANPLITEKCSYEEKLNILYRTFSSKTTIECWSRLKAADSKAEKLLGIKKLLVGQSEVFIGYIYSSYNGKDNDKFYKMLCFLFPRIEELFDEKDVGFLLEYPGLLSLFINYEARAISSKLFSALSNKAYLGSIWNALRKLLKDNILLNWIDNYDFVIHYRDILAKVQSGVYSSALSAILKVLDSEYEIPFEEELLFLSLNVSAAAEDGAVFVFVKKLQTQLFIRQKRFDEASQALKDLLEMCPQDEDVLQLNKWLEEENE